MGSAPRATALTSTATVVLLAALTLVLGCHGREVGIVYVNDTEDILEVTIDGSPIFTLWPGEEREHRTREPFLPDRIQAYSGNQLAHDDTVTWDELDANDFRYVIDGTIEPLVETSTPNTSSSKTAIP